MSRSASRDRLILELRRSAGPAALFLVLVVAGLFAAVSVVRNLAGDKPWVSYEPYKLGFDDVEGVVPGRHELRIAGVKAGSITGSKLENGRPVLTVNVEKKYAPLHVDAKAVIRPVTALEDMYVDITSRGSASKPVLGPNQVLAETRTKSKTEVGRVLNVLEPDARARFSTLLNELGRGTDDRGRKLNEAFAQLGPFLETATALGDALKARRQNTARLVHNFGNITEVLSQRDAELAGFVKEGGKVLNELARKDATLSATLGRLPGTVQNLQATFANVRATTEPLDAAVKSLSPVAASLPKGLESLAGFSKDATPALRALRPSVRALRPLARELPKTSQNAAEALRPLAPQSTQLARATKTIEPCLPLYGTALSRAMSITKYNDNGWSANGRATASAGFAVLGGLLPNPDWRITPYCGIDPEAAIKAADPPGARSSVRRLPTRDDAVSQEQK